MTIDLRISEASKKIQLHAKCLQIQSVKVNGLAMSFDLLDHDILQINSTIKFPIGNHKLQIEYTGINSGKEFVGFFRTRTGRKTEDGSVEYALGLVKITGICS